MNEIKKLRFSSSNFISSLLSSLLFTLLLHIFPFLHIAFQEWLPKNSRMRKSRSLSLTSISSIIVRPPPPPSLSETKARSASATKTKIVRQFVCGTCLLIWICCVCGCLVVVVVGNRQWWRRVSDDNGLAGFCL